MKRVSRSATRGHIHQELLNFADWLAVGCENTKARFAIRRLLDSKDGHRRPRNTSVHRQAGRAVWRLTPVGLRPPSVSRQTAHSQDLFRRLAHDDDFKKSRDNLSKMYSSRKRTCS